jgi:Uma2 family endonuclease
MPVLVDAPLLAEPDRAASAGSVTESSSEQRLVLFHVPWDHYEQFCELFAAHNVRLAYQQGTLEIMAPSMGHESSAFSSGHAVVVLAEEMDVPILPGRSVTLKILTVDCGIEPDNCFWIANEALIRDKKEIDVNVDPPPDLFVEVEVSRSFLDRLEIAAKLKVPEVWHIRDTELQVLLLQADGTYADSDRSGAFPDFPVKGIARFLQRAPGVDYTTQMRRLREWVREQLPGRDDGQ